MAENGRWDHACIRQGYFKLPWSPSPSTSTSSGSSASAHTCGWTLTSRLRLSQLVCSRDDPAIPPTASKIRWVTSCTTMSHQYLNSISHTLTGYLNHKYSNISRIIPADLLCPSYCPSWGAYWRSHWECCARDITNEYNIFQKEISNEMCRSIIVNLTTWNMILVVVCQCIYEQCWCLCSDTVCVSTT